MRRSNRKLCAGPVLPWQETTQRCGGLVSQRSSQASSKRGYKWKGANSDGELDADSLLVLMHANDTTPCFQRKSFFHHFLPVQKRSTKETLCQN